VVADCIITVILVANVRLTAACYSFLTLLLSLGKANMQGNHMTIVKKQDKLMVRVHAPSPT